MDHRQIECASVCGAPSSECTFRLRILLFLAELDSITHLYPSNVIPVLLKPDFFFKDNDFSVLPIFPFLNAIAFCTTHYGVQPLYEKSGALSFLIVLHHPLKCRRHAELMHFKRRSFSTEITKRHAERQL